MADTKPLHLAAMLLNCGADDVISICKLLDVFYPNGKRIDAIDIAKEAGNINANSVILSIFEEALHYAIEEVKLSPELQQQFASGGYEIWCNCLDSYLKIIVDSEYYECDDYDDIIKYLKAWRRTAQKQQRTARKQ